MIHPVFNAPRRHNSPRPVCSSFQAGASGLLRAFRSPAFDVSMNRKPSAVLATDFFSVDRQDTGASILSSVDEADGRQHRRLLREKKGGKLDGMEPSADSFHLSDSSSSTDITTSSSTSSSYFYPDSDSGSSGNRQGARGRRGRGRKSFKEWQDDARWDLKVREKNMLMLVLVAGLTENTVGTKGA